MEYEGTSRNPLTATSAKIELYEVNPNRKGEVS